MNRLSEALIKILWVSLLAVPVAGHAQQSPSSSLNRSDALSIAYSELKRKSVDVTGYTAQPPKYDQERREWSIYFRQAHPPLIVDGDITVIVNDSSRQACIYEGISASCK